MKRQRVGIACDKCRLLKAKCDGRQPVCSRCDGYGFNCSWTTRRQRESSGRQADTGGQIGSVTNEFLLAYTNAVQSYEALIRELRPNLDSFRQTTLDLSLQNIRRQLPETTKGEQLARGRAMATHEDYATESSPTYVGKASDIHFIHSVREYVSGHCPPAEDDLPSQSYTQYHSFRAFAAFTRPVLVPSEAEADQFLDVYLSTIHIAYPFICRSVLLKEFQRFKTGDHDQPDFQPWLALFNCIFAIGSYYTSFPHGKHSDSQHHFRYFEQGLFFSRELGADCALVNVWILLVQCFFLLAVCHTDRCWNTLGFAIRMGQSIGLHVEISPNCNSSKEPWMKDRTHLRRTWYSMYVLDRLLALQLGRPMAIHEADFKVDLPSVTDESPFGKTSDDVSSRDNRLACGHMMDYFLEVIRFSRILGLVIRELYRPSQIDLSPDQMLHSTASLDQRLAEWKLGLPRHLRFDLGHTFEKSVSFKRQRNMLAVKFHHLRALIHRPFLCLPFLQMNNMPFIDLLLQHKQRISEAEYICIHEAQQTAHLLHNVTDERSLVHDFPWWQMISCLICASSILFVAETFYSHNVLLHGRTSAQSLREDAESCLKVFEALSVNSVAAQRAADMLAGLSSMRRSCEESSFGTTVSSRQATSLPLTSAPAYSESAGTTDSASSVLPSLPPSAITFPCEWPSEISSAMEWSVQFLDHPLFQQFDQSLVTNSSHR